MAGRVLEMLGSREVSVNEIWPCVPLAPSHPLHVMLPRITRNSHRPRASDRTMVDTLNHRSLVALANSMALPPASRETYENQKAKLLQRSRWTVGWVSRIKSQLR